MRCPFAVWIGSPNYWPGRLPLESIVDHIAQGTLVGTDAWFNNPDNDQASSHFEVGKKGEIHQYVETDDSAWGNGVLLKPDLTVPWIAQAFASKTYAEYWSRHPNRRTISIEHEGYTGEPWTEAMYASDLRLKRWLLETHEFGQSIEGHLLLGHHQFDSVNRSRCPGTGWPKERLFADLMEDDMRPDEVIALIKAHAPQAIMDALATPDGVAFKGLKREVAEEAQKLLTAHAATPHGGTGGLTTEQVKQIVRDLVKE